MFNIVLKSKFVALLALLIAVGDSEEALPPVASDCEVKFSTKKLTEKVQEWLYEEGCDRKDSECRFKNCSTNCDCSTTNNVQNGCDYECTHVGTDRAEAGQYSIRGAEVTANEEKFKVSMNGDAQDIRIKEAAESCPASSKDAKETPTFIWIWKCGQCRTTEDGEPDNFYNKAPYFWQRCCEECATLAEREGMNVADNPNFLICESCDNVHTFKHFEQYIETEIPVRTKNTNSNMAQFNGTLSVSNGYDTPEEFHCQAAMENVDFDITLSTLNCGECTNELDKDNCCETCATSDEDGLLLACTGCEDNNVVDRYIEAIEEHLYDTKGISIDIIPPDSTSNLMIVVTIMLMSILLL